MIRAILNIAEKGTTYASSTAYTQGDITNHSDTIHCLVCIESGTSGAEPSMSGKRKFDIVTSGTATFVVLLTKIYLADVGGMVEGVHYRTGIVEYKIKYTADPIDRVSSGQIGLSPHDTGIIYVQNTVEFSCEIYDDDVLEFKGKAVRNNRGKTFVYQLKTINPQVDVLDDFSGEIIPKVYGAVKYVVPQLVNEAYKVYRVGGIPITVYDAGQSVKFTIYKIGDVVHGSTTYLYEVFVPANPILADITVDAIAGVKGTTTVTNATRFAQRKYNMNFKGVIQAGTPATTDDWLNVAKNLLQVYNGTSWDDITNTLLPGDIFVERDNKNLQYRWDGSGFGTAITAPDDADETAGILTSKGIEDNADNTTLKVNAGVVIENTATDPDYVTVIGGFLLSGSLTQRNDLDSTDINAATAVQQTQYIWQSTTWVEVLQLRADGGIYIDKIYAGRGKDRYQTNTAFGEDTLLNQTEDVGGYNNTTIGYKGLRENTTGRFNTAIGSNSMLLNETGDQNTALGYASLDDCISGNQNTTIGYSAASAITSGYRNVALGYLSFVQETTGYENTAIGDNSLYASNGGIRNTALGSASGNTITTGHNNLTLGYRAGSSSSPFNITTQSDRIVIGDSFITNAYIAVAWTVTSDKRDKKDIEKLPIGLDFIMGLKPITYKWDNRSRYKNGKSNGSKKDTNINLGFLAQDIAKLETKFNMPNDVIANTEQKNKFMLKETALIPVLVKAIQELKKEIEFLKRNPK